MNFKPTIKTISTPITSQIANQVIDSCSSTNDLARSLGEDGYPHGTWVSARTQECGRGRTGREWKSLEGNLFLSLVIRPPSRDGWSWIPLATAVGVTKFLREHFNSLEIKIKWPNDLFLNESKLGGILCEGIGKQAGSFVVVGLGLNCVQSPKALDQATTSLSEALSKHSSLSRPVVADDIRLPLVEFLLEIFDCFFSNLANTGVAMQSASSAKMRLLSKQYTELSFFQPGMPVQWLSGTPAINHFGKINGIGEFGELLVTQGDGSTVRLFAEEVHVRRG